MKDILSIFSVIILFLVVSVKCFKEITMICFKPKYFVMELCDRKIRSFKSRNEVFKFLLSGICCRRNVLSDYLIFYGEEIEAESIIDAKEIEELLNGAAE